MLRRFRTGPITAEDRDILEDCVVTEEEALRFIAEPETVYLASLNANVDAANAVACAKLKAPNEDIIKLKADNSHKTRHPREEPLIEDWLQKNKDKPEKTGGVRGEVRVGDFIFTFLIFFQYQ